MILYLRAFAAALLTLLVVAGWALLMAMSVEW
jgi:hypothetical protein